MVRHMVGKIRKCYRQQVLILVCLDNALFDQKLFEVFGGLKFGYTCGGKLYHDIRAYVEAGDRSGWGQYQNAEKAWDYMEFGDRRSNGSSFCRAFYCRAMYEGTQQLLPFAPPETVLSANLGMGSEADKQLEDVGGRHWLKAAGIIECAHGRRPDELVHRALKEFGPEMLPFKRFVRNAAFYNTMPVGFFPL